ELARGGMGTVYLARAVGVGGFERLVAIKRAHENLLTSDQAARRFLDEARIVAHVHHSNVVGIHQVGQDESGYYLVLDYVEGESLGGLIARASRDNERLPPAIVTRVALDALAGLHAAHETADTSGKPLGILHRDVSIQNLLVGRDGVTRLTDFGVAKSTLSSVVTEAGYVQGKLVYMPPEYLRRQAVDRTLDIYAMGITLFTAFTGQHPWHGLGHAEIVQAVLGGGVPRIASEGFSVPASLEEIVARACAGDPRQRFQTARQMLDALEAAGSEGGYLARHTEVAEYVERQAGTELRERREAVSNQPREVQGTARTTGGTAQLDVVRTDPATGSDSWLTELSSDTGVRAFEASLGVRRLKAKPLAFAALALAVVGGTLGLVFSRDDPEQRSRRSKTDDSVAAEVDERSRGAAQPEPEPDEHALDSRGAARTAANPRASADLPDAQSGTPSASAAARSQRSGAARSKRSPASEKLNQISTANPYRRRAP
ncbi:MAG TPA: serine/threonine-protein kinase, partial [Polyangiaceae bacterium]|nr:serine/threonine-protein kinase [Polyangiaceae bacterium]